MMKNTQIIFILSLLFSFVISAQGTIEGKYIQLTSDEYSKLTEINKENKLDGKYYVREFKDRELIGIHKIEYQKGKKHGEWLHFLIFRKKGTLDLSIIENYDDNKRNGYYYNSDNGFTFTEEGYYEKGEKEGLWNVTKSESKEKINFKNGKKHGDYWRQDTSGVIVKGAYKKGEKLDNWTIEDLSGDVKTLGEDTNTINQTTPNPIQTIQGKVEKPDSSAASIAVVRLYISDSSCAYAFTDFEGKFSIEVDTKKITPNSYFEIVKEGFPKRTVLFSEFTDQGVMLLKKGRTKITYDEYRNYYTSMKDCNL